MDQRAAKAVASRFSEYIEHLSEVIGHADRHEPLAAYCTGLLLPGSRKSVEPMAARIAPDEVGAKHPSLHHFVAKAPWDEAELLAAVRTFVLPKIEKQAPIRGWIIDDTGIPKKGKHSVAVTRQYCGELGKQDNCQVAVTLSVASDYASLPIALRLYLPEVWANDTAFRSGLTELNLDYVVGIQGSTTVWAPGTEPLPARTGSGNGRKTKLLRRDETTKPIKVSALARSLPRQAWKNVRWREGSKGDLVSRFTALRVRPSHRDYWRAEPWPQEWLLIEWPKDKDEPLKYWLSTMPAETTIAELVDTAKLRWRIERDFQDLKQEIGLDHYEGRPSGAWLRQDVGEASTITRHSRSQLTDSSSRRGVRFPPRHRSSKQSQAKPRPTPKVTARAARPLRPERHTPNSISTLRTLIAVALANQLPRCPCCMRKREA